MNERLSVFNRFRFKKRMIFAESDKEAHDRATHHISEGYFKNNDMIVRDHCHLKVNIEELHMNHVILTITYQRFPSYISQFGWV